MPKLIASMNFTLDGYCNHTAMTVSNELMEYSNKEMRDAGMLLFGRITYQLMEDYWPGIASNPGDNKQENEFAVLMDNIPKVVFSKTLQSVDWKNATLATGNLNEEVLKLKQQPGKDIMVGSPSLIAQLTEHGLIDEYRLCLHPVILGSGLVLFKNITHRVDIKLIKTQTFASGVVVLYYERVNGGGK